MQETRNNNNEHLIQRSIPRALFALQVHINDDEDNDNDTNDDSSTNINTVPILKLLATSTYKKREKKTDIVQDKHNKNT